MQVTLDPYMHRRLELPEIFRLAAELGYPCVELSFREDFVPLFVAPAATPETIRAVRQASAKLVSRSLRSWPCITGRVRIVRSVGWPLSIGKRSFGWRSKLAAP